VFRVTADSPPPGAAPVNGSSGRTEDGRNGEPPTAADVQEAAADPAAGDQGAAAGEPPPRCAGGCGYTGRWMQERVDGRRWCAKCWSLARAREEAMR